MSQNNSSDEECNENIIKENNKLSIDNLVNSKPFKKVLHSTILSMKNLFQSGKTSLTNKNNIIHKPKNESNNSSFDEEFLEEMKGIVDEDIIAQKKNKTDIRNKNIKTEKKANVIKKTEENKNDNKSNDLDKYCLFLHEDEEKNKKIYTFHRDHGNKYDLRCKDRNCLGTAKYDVESGEIKITKKCSITNFNEHNYVKEKSFIERIKANQVENDEMKNPQNQKFFFKYSYIENPNLTYLDVIYKINDKYNVENISFSEKQFNNMKFRINKQNNFNKIKEDRLKLLEVSGEKLWKCSHEYISVEKKDYMYRLFGTKFSLSLLNDDKIIQYFIDSTYRCVPLNYLNTKALLLIAGYNSQYDMLELCCVAILSAENTELQIELYDYLKNIYKFNPQLITYDFALANIQAINIVFKSSEIEILPCFSIWFNVGGKKLL